MSCCVIVWLLCLCAAASHHTAGVSVCWSDKSASAAAAAGANTHLTWLPTTRVCVCVCVSVCVCALFVLTNSCLCVFVVRLTGSALKAAAFSHSSDDRKQLSLLKQRLNDAKNSSLYDNLHWNTFQH